MDLIYLIRDNGTGLHKIGMTSNWDRRRTELRVGNGSTEVKVIRCTDARKWERVLHAMFKHKRLPQSEWFRINAEDAIPKMEWLARQSSQPMVIGNWKQAQAGHWYRRRKSSSGNWYTEQKDAYTMREILKQQLDTAIGEAEQQWRFKSRQEPGFWPTPEDKQQLLWQDKDPTLTNNGCSPVLLVIAIAAAIILGVISNSNTDQRDPQPSPNNQEQPYDRLPVRPKPPLTQPPSIPPSGDDHGPIGQRPARPAIPPVPMPNEPNEPIEPEDLVLPRNSECVFQSYKDLQPRKISCSVKSRVNTNRHAVYDVDWSDRVQSTYIFWADGRVEILVKGQPIEIGKFRRENDAVIISSSEGSKTIIPGLDPLEN